MKCRIFQVIVMSGALAACGPPMHDLLSENHFREATCATMERPGERDVVSGAMTRALDPQLHVEILSDETVTKAAPAAPSDVRARSFFVRVRVVTNEIPVDHLGIALNAVGDVPAHPITLTALASLTGEHAPPSHTATETHEIMNFVSGAVAVFSGGLIDAGQRGPTTYEVPATIYEWELTAPNAARLFHAFGSPGCNEQRGGTEDMPHVGMSCDASFLVERGGSGSLALDLDVEYGADRLTRNTELRTYGADDTWKCRVKTRMHVSLGDVANLPQKTAATFGATFRAVSELDTLAKK